MQLQKKWQFRIEDKEVIAFFLDRFNDVLNSLSHCDQNLQEVAFDHSFSISPNITTISIFPDYLCIQVFLIGVNIKKLVKYLLDIDKYIFGDVTLNALWPPGPQTDIPSLKIFLSSSKLRQTQGLIVYKLFIYIVSNSHATKIIVHS